MSGPRAVFTVGPEGQTLRSVLGSGRATERKDSTMSGEADQAKGRIKEAVGDLTDDKDLKREGKVDKGAGKVKGAVDNIKDKLKRD